MQQDKKTSVALENRPQPKLEWIEVETATINEYAKIARKLGYEPPELTRDLLACFLRKNEIGVFDYQKVCDWLTRVCGNEGLDAWCWRPLRKQDVVDFTWYEEGWELRVGGKKYGFYNPNLCSHYKGLIPIQAIKLVDRIESEFGDKVCFFVSDYPSIHPPDPFLMVRPREENETENNYGFHFVIAVWDEPGFGE